MKIVIDAYEMESDGRCITLYENKIKADGNDKGGVHRAFIGHYPNVSQACDRLLEEKMAKSHAKNITELRADILKYHNDVLIKLC